jgi:hypothetical protein
MTDEEGQKAKEQEKHEKKQKPEVPLPFCTTTPDPEQGSG